jgi:hypothetical protein
MSWQASSRAYPADSEPWLEATNTVGTAANGDPDFITFNVVSHVVQRESVRNDWRVLWVTLPPPGAPRLERRGHTAQHHR